MNLKLNNKYNKWRNYSPVLFFFVLLIGVTSCYTDYGLTTADYDVVVTKYDKETDFAALNTFSLVDSVYHITGDSTKPDSDLLTRDNDALIISTIRQNMLDLGYVEVINPSDQNKPAVVIVIRALGTQVDQYYAYYPGWGYPGWGWGYPGYYPPYVGKSTYYLGSLFIDYYDVAASENENDYVFPWYATINGLLNSGQTEQRLVNTINQAFIQSPYLKVN